MSAARRRGALLPPELMRRVPFRLLMIFQSHRFFAGFGYLLALFMIYGPLPLRLADHNAYRYLLGPFVFPAVALAALRAFPVRPYRGARVRSEGMGDLDERDAEARRLADAFVSDEARAFLVRSTVRLSLLLFAPMLALSFAFRGSLRWTLLSPWLVQGGIVAVIGSWIALVSVLVNRVLTTWADGAAAPADRLPPDRGPG